jgi:hypothetical protein
MGGLRDNSSNCSSAYHACRLGHVYCAARLAAWLLHVRPDMLHQFVLLSFVRYVLHLNEADSTSNVGFIAETKVSRWHTMDYACAVST